MKSEKYQKGLAKRREVMGDEHVDRSMKNVDEFSQTIQDFVVENCWGEIWTREAIPQKTRSLITIGMLSAMRATNELKGHVRGGLRNGCTVEEIQEVLLQTAAYCGAAAGLEAFRAAKEVIDSWEG